MIDPMGLREHPDSMREEKDKANEELDEIFSDLEDAYKKNQEIEKDYWSFIAIMKEKYPEGKPLSWNHNDYGIMTNLGNAKSQSSKAFSSLYKRASGLQNLIDSYSKKISNYDNFSSSYKGAGDVWKAYNAKQDQEAAFHHQRYTAKSGDMTGSIIEAWLVGSGVRSITGLTYNLTASSVRKVAVSALTNAEAKIMQKLSGNWAKRAQVMMPGVPANLATSSAARVAKASDLSVLKPGTKAWDNAVNSLSGLGKGKVNYRTGSATDAKSLLEQARGKMNRNKQYTQQKYKKGYETHNSQNPRELGAGNDLQHLKWKDGKSGGHIYYNKPN